MFCCAQKLYYQWKNSLMTKDFFQKLIFYDLHLALVHCLKQKQLSNFDSSFSSNKLYTMLSSMHKLFSLIIYSA